MIPPDFKAHLVSYADARFRHAQTRLVSTCSQFGINQIHAFGPEQLRQTPFYSQHRDILDQPRGGGYWLWKPYYIREVMRQARPGDAVLYIDSGAELIGSVGPLVETCRQADGLLLFRNHGRPNRYWVKRDCYVRMQCDTPACHDADQVNAAFLVMIAGSAAAEEFLERWLELCTDAQLITDLPSKCGLPELPDYVTHLHDQAILSLVAFERGTPLYRDPSQFGNHRKLPELRVPGEHLELPYTSESCTRSHYPTLINHHRTSAPPPDVVRKFVGRLKIYGRTLVPKKWPNPYFASNDLVASMRVNRKTLAGVEKWFDPQADAASQFGYGVPDRLRKQLDRPVGSQPTVPDLIGNLSAALKTPLNYLEIGVSVGKNFLQQLRATTSPDAAQRTLTGFDIEEMHPNLTSRLQETACDRWDPAADSLKRGANSLRTFHDPGQGGTVRYLAGDVFDESCWRRLQGRPFNFIFSDALHRPEGLMFEWRMIERHGLLDQDEFVMMWDDLGGYMTLAFDRICEQVQAQAGSCCKLLVKMRGWMGVNEYPHEIGVLAKLKNPPEWLRKAHA